MLYIDQMQRRVEISESPQRIISVVPSQTELLYDLGVAHRLIGITKFCIHPNDFFLATKKIGGTKTLRLEQIAALEPDLIIANKEENTQSDIEWLSARFPVWISDILNTSDALNMIHEVGQLVQAPDKAKAIIAQLNSDFESIKALAARYPHKRVAYLIWRKPYMVAAKGTFIHEMLNLTGFTNVFAHLERYPSVSLEDLNAAAPDLIFCSSEPYPFTAAHFEELQVASPNSRLQLVDGEVFSWYGTRLLHLKSYYQQVLNPLVQ